jgi:Fe(3+) dicitrate transport protein
MDAFDADSGEPGGLTFRRDADFLNYDADRDATQLQFDRVRVERYMPSLTLEHDFSDQTLLTATAYGGYFGRFSKRQQGTGFGSLPNLSSSSSADNNLIQLQEFYTFGTDVRLRHDWFAWENEHTLTAGFSTYYSDSPYTTHRGNTPDAESGELRQKVDRESIYGAPFVENRFVFGKFSVTPAFRLENIAQSVDEKVNLGTGETATPSRLSKDCSVETVPLFGIGLAYEIGAESEIYANASQGYKAKTYADAVPLGANDTISEDLDPSEIWTAEIGVRGTPTSWLTYDTSLFFIDYKDRFGRVGRNIQNVGRSHTFGWDAAAEVDIVGVLDAWRGTKYTDSFGSFSLYGNVELLHAEFVEGTAATEGQTPQYAPDYLVRAGAIYRWRDRVKIALLGTFVDGHWANDNNGLFSAADPFSSGFIPGYMVWDLTAEAKVYRGRTDVSLIAGVNNLFDEDYYSRVRSNGIDPAYGRNYYGGVAVSF